MVAATAASHWAASVTSQATTIASPPPARISCATGSMAPVSRPASAIRHPSAANALETAAPIPLAGPVIKATRPLRRRSIAGQNSVFGNSAAGGRNARVKISSTLGVRGSALASTRMSIER